MRILFSISFFLTLALIYLLNSSWNLNTTPIPPLGKFLDPFHGFWANAETVKRNPEELHFEGLKERVTIVYDSAAIPHIFAKNDDDLYFAQGYVTAQDRLWQMEFQTHSAAGRISEIVGSIALDLDRGTRRQGLQDVARNSVAALEQVPKAKAMIDHYALGVNAYISSLNYERLPIEYKLLSYEPEPWTNLKVGLLLANMARTLNEGSKDIRMTNALRLFGKPTLDLLFPDNEKPGDPIVDEPGNWNFKPITLDSVPLALPNELLQTEEKKFNHDIGSNNWAVSGAKTRSGSPILCSDPHLGLNLPSLWYVVQLNAPGINVMGGTLPGAPPVVIGFNDSIAWGMTNAQRDLVDWYKIEFRDSSRNEYLSDGKWKKTRKVVEKFLVKGNEPFYDTIVYTHHGPIRFDKYYHSPKDGSALAYTWISTQGLLEFFAFYKLNRSKNYHDFMAALDDFGAPAHNFAFASVNGDIAMRTQGKFPVRRKDEGKFVLDGTRTSQEWKAFIPSDQNVQYKNPIRGFVSSANQYPADDTYPYYIQSTSYEAYRNRRINMVLSTLNNIVPQDMMNLQQDNYNLRAAESLPFMLSFIDSTGLAAFELAALRALRRWDYMMNIDSEAAAYYEGWWDALYDNLWRDMANAAGSVPLPTYYTTIKLIKEKQDLNFIPLPAGTRRTALSEIITTSFSEMLKGISKWKEGHKTDIAPWADVKDTYVKHLARLPAFSEHVRHGGGTSVVNATTEDHGPSWRMVVSLEKKGVRAWGVYPGGQSGNPGSPYYTNLLGKWADGKYLSLHFKPSAAELNGCALATTSMKKK